MGFFSCGQYHHGNCYITSQNTIILYDFEDILSKTHLNLYKKLFNLYEIMDNLYVYHITVKKTLHLAARYSVNQLISPAASMRSAAVGRFLLVSSLLSLHLRVRWLFLRQ